MVMKVQQSNSASLTRLQHAGKVASREIRSSPDAGAGDHVQISTPSSVLTALDVHSGEYAAKVVQLSGAVASNRYQVDAGAVSARLIQEHMRAAA
jgi:anti-sigma28 factor (negative regulator of flagellin synthesis)